MTTTQPTSQPVRPPRDRTGRTHDFRIGKHTVSVVVNRTNDGRIIEVFAKTDLPGARGHIENVCRQISLGLQGRGDIKTVISHLRGDQTEPCGGPGQPRSIYDGLSRVLQSEMDKGTATA